MTEPEVAIIGVGLHPFGRYDGKSALELCEDAVTDALAGVRWSDVQALWTSSMEVNNPEAITGLLGMTGILARATVTGCASGATVLAQAANPIRLGDHELTVAVGLDKHPRGAFSDPRPRSPACLTGTARPDSS